MAFELETKTKVRVLDVRTLAAKDRKPDEPPGAQLLLQAMLPASSLTMFDGALASWLYRKAAGAKQGALEGMEGQELTSVGQHIKRIPWVYEQTGCEIEIDLGLGGKRSNLELSDCKVHRVSFIPQQGGGVQTQWTVDIPGLSDAVRGKLTGLKSTEIEMTLAQPEVQQEDLDGVDQPSGETKELPSGAWPFPKDKDSKTPAQSAAEAFAANEAEGKNTPARRGGKLAAVE